MAGFCSILSESLYGLLHAIPETCPILQFIHQLSTLLATSVSSSTLLFKSSILAFHLLLPLQFVAWYFCFALKCFLCFYLSLHCCELVFRLITTHRKPILGDQLIINQRLTFFTSHLFNHNYQPFHPSFLPFFQICLQKAFVSSQDFRLYYQNI